MGGLPFPGPLVLAVINLAFRMFPEVLVEILFGWRCVPRDPPPGYTRGRERGGERESVRVTESEAVCMIYRERLALSCVCVCVCVCVCSGYRRNRSANTAHGSAHKQAALPFSSLCLATLEEGRQKREREVG